MFVSVSLNCNIHKQRQIDKNLRAKVKVNTIVEEKQSTANEEQMDILTSLANFTELSLPDVVTYQQKLYNLRKTRFLPPKCKNFRSFFSSLLNYTRLIFSA